MDKFPHMLIDLCIIRIFNGQGHQRLYINKFMPCFGKYQVFNVWERGAPGDRGRPGMSFLCLSCYYLRILH